MHHKIISQKVLPSFVKGRFRTFRWKMYNLCNDFLVYLSKNKFPSLEERLPHFSSEKGAKIIAKFGVNTETSNDYLVKLAGRNPLKSAEVCLYLVALHPNLGWFNAILEMESEKGDRVFDSLPNVFQNNPDFQKKKYFDPIYKLNPELVKDMIGKEYFFQTSQP